jgi:hypothetical protein
VVAQTLPAVLLWDAIPQLSCSMNASMLNDCDGLPLAVQLARHHRGMWVNNGLTVQKSGGAWERMSRLADGRWVRESRLDRCVQVSWLCKGSTQAICCAWVKQLE